MVRPGFLDPFSCTMLVNHVCAAAVQSASDYCVCAQVEHPTQAHIQPALRLAELRNECGTIGLLQRQYKPFARAPTQANLQCQGPRSFMVSGINLCYQVYTCV